MVAWPERHDTRLAPWENLQHIGMITLAERMSHIDASGIRKVFDLARHMVDPINLSIGQPDFDVPEPIKEAAIAAIRAGRNSYTPTQGVAELAEQVRAIEQEASGRSWSNQETLITSGVSGGLLLSILALINPGDEVLIPDPYFVMYKHLVRLVGGVPVYVDTYATDFLLAPAALEAAMTPRTRLLLLNSPANPTGRIIDETTTRSLAEICTRNELLVISDEIYRSFAYQPVCSFSRYHERTLTLGGYSKAFGMTGWRLGYAVGPAELVQAMAMIQQYSFVCAPSVSQYAALACPQVDMRAHIDTYRAKRDLMVGLLSERFTVAPADGAFYLWIAAPAGQSGDSFVERAIAAHVLVIPGSVFSERDSHFRVCYTVPDEALRAGAERLCALV